MLFKLCVYCSIKNQKWYNCYQFELLQLLRFKIDSTYSCVISLSVIWWFCSYLIGPRTYRLKSFFFCFVLAFEYFSILAINFAEILIVFTVYLSKKVLFHWYFYFQLFINVDWLYLIIFCFVYFFVLLYWYLQFSRVFSFRAFFLKIFFLFKLLKWLFFIFLLFFWS